MTDLKRIEFRQMLAIFLESCSLYPGDSDRMENMVRLLESFIDREVDNAILKTAAGSGKLFQDGKFKA